MPFPQRFKEDFIKELEKIKTLMDQTPNQWTKIYLFSALHAFLNRVINFEYDKELLLLERVINCCHVRTTEDFKKALQARMQLSPPPDLMIPKGSDLETQKLPPEYSPPENTPLIIINPKFFEILSGYIEDLKNSVEHDENLLLPVSNIAELFYTLTGNGVYLQKKGIIKLDLE